MITDDSIDWDVHTQRALNARKDLFCFVADDKVLGAEKSDDPVYLNAAYIMPLLKASANAAKEGIQMQSRPWKLRYPGDFRHLAEKARDLFANVIGAPTSTISVIPSVAYAVATVVNHIRDRITKGDCILLLHDQYTSNALAWQRLAEEKGARVEFVNRETSDESNREWTAAVVEAVKKFSPILTSIPAACHWCDGSNINLAEVSKACRSLSGLLFVDGTQSVGVVPFDLEQVQPDYVAVSGYKWLCCPYGLAFMYVAEKHHNSGPLEMHGLVRKNGGFMSDGSYDVKELYNIRANDYIEGARRYDSGQNNNFVTLTMAIAGLEQVLEWQRDDDVRKHIEPLMEYLCERVSSVGIVVPPRNSRSPHIVGLRFPRGSQKACARELACLAQELKNRNIFVSIRGDSIRVSLHIWTTKSDIDRLYYALADFIAQP
mmetsp:Transcript_7820/g.9921  ORF Transcript_7820/g.9921 Transcript_7820/m.9921 type:complete len:432 (-) Transcript_7820:720-2015(-)